MDNSKSGGGDSNGIKEAIIEEVHGWIKGVSNGGVGGRIDSKICTNIHFLTSRLIHNLLIIVHFYICCYNPKPKQEK